MNNKYAITLIIAAALVFFAVHKGVITAIKKTLDATPKVETDPNEKLRIQQRDRMKEVRERQEEYMRSQKERMRDLQRR